MLFKSGKAGTIRNAGQRGIAVRAALGTMTLRNKTRLLAENWNGTRWTVGAPVAPPHVKSSAFGGVSCLAKQGCIAVGSYLTFKEKLFPLAEQHS